MNIHHFPTMYKSLAWHLRTGALYRVLGEARCVGSGKILMTYSQTEWTTCCITKKDLPPGTLWVRDKQDFYSKFRRYDCKRKHRS